MTKHVPSNEDEKAMAEFFAKGGVIQKIPTGVSGREEGVKYPAWGAPRKKAGRPPSDATADKAPKS
jgi:hypothetical protein